MRFPTFLGLSTLLTLGMATAAPASTPEELIRLNCAGCHTAADDPGAALTRMSEQRKTPEGWQMTLVRMRQLHQVPLQDPDGSSEEDVLHSLVKYFADSQGLSPEESKPYRYILEQRLNTMVVPEDAEFGVMCTRCHSGARVGLQRRSESEWRHLVHFHLAQFPTAEYQAGGRDRDWLGTALNRMVPMLSQKFALQSASWTEWQAASKPVLAGKWRLYGSMPGKGDFEGVMNATAAEGDTYELTFSGRFGNGEALEGQGSSIVYTGYEWRASLTLGDQHYRQVMTATADGSALSGRMFLSEHEESGIDLNAAKDQGKARLLAVSPAYIRQGSEQELTLTGTALKGRPDLGTGIQVIKTLSSDSDRLVLQVKSSADATAGARTIKLGSASMEQALTVYSQVDRVEVTPGYAVGRVGGDGGSQPVVRATYEALAWSNGADGQPATADDLRIGVMPAQWSVAPWDERAVSDQDVKFAGSMDKDNGVFTPAAAGPNPERKYQTNNAGNLKVIGTVNDGDRTLQGEAHLLVTVQRWNNPPIR